MKKPYVITVTETLTREVIVYAEDKDEAVELAEDMCNDDIINLTAKDFEERDVECQGLAQVSDFGEKPVYGYKRFFTSSGEISEEDADAINETNKILLESGDFEKMKDVCFIFWKEGADDRKREVKNGEVI